MKWRALPGPAGFIERALQQIHDGISVVVAAPTLVPLGFEDAFVDPLEHGHWRVERVTVDSSGDPLESLTEKLQVEPEQWVGWSVERLFERLPARQVIAVEGVTDTNWDVWRTFLREFETASRSRASDERALMLVLVRGVPHKRLKSSEGAALVLMRWSGVIGELDVLIYADQRLRCCRTPPRHHKLIVRQIAALSLWDLDLADFLTEQSESDMFDVQAVLQAARQALGRDGAPTSASWEDGGSDHVDGVERFHPFLLVDQTDRSNELTRRLWTAQAAELLPLIEERRRDLVKSLDRHISCPFWLDQRDEGGGQTPVRVKVRSLNDLEIGSLAYVTQIQGVRGELRDRAEWLAKCRNTLAHLGLLSARDALDSRLHG